MLNSKNEYVKSVLNDVKALEYMLNNSWFEEDITRIGAEQEIILVDRRSYKPSTKASAILEKHPDWKWLVSELAKFNLELNLNPQVFQGNCLSHLHHELDTNLGLLRDTLSSMDLDYVLTGILPTLRKFHLDLENLTPKQRYKELMSALASEIRDKNFELRLVGIDELLVRHDSPLLEACNTSFQVHLQVAPSDFVDMYNCALALTAPSIAISANSPIVFGKRLWHESRIALFQQSIDTRKVFFHMREMSPRVILGDSWLDNSVMEIFYEDIARFRVLLHAEPEEDSLKLIQTGKVPKLKSLQLQNSTVYRWNRPCYGISDTGKPHLRIENRVFPSGPTILDEVSNAALWLGAMIGLKQSVSDIRNYLSFEDIRDNFGKSARFGIDSKFTWFKDKKVAACDLILEEILPLARAGLEHMNVSTEDTDLYLGTIEERAKSYMNGARWMLRSYTKLKKEAANEDEALTILTASIMKNQQVDKNPIHKWKEPSISDLVEYRPGHLRVSEFMHTNLFTATKNDLVELVIQLMKWKDLEYMAVEDESGNLVGLISLGSLVDALTEEKNKPSPKDVLVSDIMIDSPITVNHDDNIQNALDLMRKNNIGCLPVVQGQELVGMLTEGDFIRITERLMKNQTESD